MKKKQALLATLACGLTGLFSSGTTAYTRVTLETTSTDTTVNEGYAGDTDLLTLDAEVAKNTNALRKLLPKNAQQNRHYFHQYQDDVVIVSVGSTVYSDTDGDGFFTHFGLTIDADIDHSEAEIYLKVWIRSDSDDYTEFHLSEAFYIYDNLSSDSYNIESKLLNNYDAAYYDFRIDVYDAHSGALLDSVDAESHDTLFALPLESAGKSSGESTGYEDGTTDAIIHAHVGATGATFASILALFSLFRLRRNTSTKTETGEAARQSH